MLGKLACLFGEVCGRTDISGQIAQVACQADAVGQCQTLSQAAGRTFFVAFCNGEYYPAQR
jgi:hypothetical protein